MLEDLSSVIPCFGTSIRGIIHDTQVVPLNARVPVPDPNRGQISRHFWLAWWSGFWQIFVFYRISLVWGYISPRRSGNHSQHPGDASERLCHSSGALSWRNFCTFLVRVVAGFWPRISRANRIYSLRAETVVDGLPRAFRFMRGWVVIRDHLGLWLVEVVTLKAMLF